MVRRLSLCTLLVATMACSAEEGSPAPTDSGQPADEGLDTSIETAPPPDGSDATPEVDGSDTPSEVSETPTSPPAVLSKVGTAGKVLLKGMVVTPDKAFAGEVFVDGNLIKCVDVSCGTTAGASEASVVETNGIIAPGMIDTHNHVLFDIFDETDWAPSATYTFHDDWTIASKEPRYAAVVDAKQWLNGEATPYPDITGGSLGCELLKYGELKALVAGTTSMIGSSGTAKKCFASLVRSLDTKYDGGISTADLIQVATLYPSASTAQGICDKMIASPPTIDAYLIHVGEGTDAKARAEFDKLGTLTTPSECLFSSLTTITHGTSFLDAELTKMADKKMSLTWSPRSNVFLYGGGTDLTKTTNIPLARTKGITVAVSPDWSMGGSQNMLDELRFADKVDNAVWGDKLDAKTLVQMATIYAAKVAHRDKHIGSIEVDKRADLMVIGGDVTKPYDALLGARPTDVRLTMVDGVILYGDPVVQPIAPAKPGCETIDICSTKKFVCVATEATTDKLNQTYADIKGILEKALSDFDALPKSAPASGYKFSPLTPLVRCP